MSEIAQLRTPVIQPIFSNRFRVRVDGLDDLTRQIVSISLNLAERKLQLDLRETIEGSVLTVLRDRTTMRVHLDFLAAGASASKDKPDPNVTHTSSFFCTIVKHDFVMSYEWSEPARHTVDLTF